MAGAPTTCVLSSKVPSRRLIRSPARDACRPGRRFSVAVIGVPSMTGPMRLAIDLDGQASALLDGLVRPRRTPHPRRSLARKLSTIRVSHSCVAALAPVSAPAPSSGHPRAHRRRNPSHAHDIEVGALISLVASDPAPASVSSPVPRSRSRMPWGEPLGGPLGTTGARLLRCGRARSQPKEQ